MRLPAVAVALLFVTAWPARAADPPAKDDEVGSAVNKALAYLKNTQHEDGSWSAGRAGVRNPAVTALCLMAFLSAGHVPGEERYGQTIEKGLRSVFKAQQGSGLIAPETMLEMYHHGICTLMLARAAAVTEGPLRDELRRRLDRAVAVILKAQRKDGIARGGWRYMVRGVDADLSVTGWQVLALGAAADVGCDVPPEVIERAVDYVKRCQDPATGGFRYMPGGRVTVACTGTGILVLETCGNDHRSEEVLKAGAYLLKNPPRWGGEQFSYSTYYCSRAASRLGGEYGKGYRQQLHKILLPNQRDNGSWYGIDAPSQIYGPSYTTAMAVLALTVE